MLESITFLSKDVLLIVFKYLKCFTQSCKSTGNEEQCLIQYNMWNDHKGIYCHECFCNILKESGKDCSHRKRTFWNYQGRSYLTSSRLL